MLPEGSHDRGHLLYEVITSVSRTISKVFFCGLGIVVETDAEGASRGDVTRQVGETLWCNPGLRRGNDCIAKPSMGSNGRSFRTFQGTLQLLTRPGPIQSKMSVIGDGTLTPFEELDDYLSQKYNINYWSDDAIDHAYELVQKMTESDWDTLESCWRTRPRQWQCYCAQLLSRADSVHAIPLLLEMIHIPDDDLAVTAADSLRSLAMDGYDVEVDSKVIKRLRALARARPGLSAEVANDLIKRLPVSS